MEVLPSRVCFDLGVGLLSSCVSHEGFCRGSLLQAGELYMTDIGNWRLGGAPSESLQPVPRLEIHVTPPSLGHQLTKQVAQPASQPASC